MDTQERRDTWMVAIFVVAAVALLVSIVGVGFGMRAIDESKGAVHTAAVAPTTTTTAVVPGPVGVSLSEFHVNLPTTIAAGQVTLNIHDTGAIQHELLVFKSDLPPNAYPLKDGNIDEDNPAITKVSDGDNLDPGAAQSRTMDLTQPGTYLFVCNLPGHFHAGMYEVVTVK